MDMKIDKMQSHFKLTHEKFKHTVRYFAGCDDKDEIYLGGI